MLAILSMTCDSGISDPLIMKSDQVIAVGWSIAERPPIETTASTFSRLPIVACSLCVHILPVSPPSIGLFPTNTTLESEFPTTHSTSSGEQVW